MKMSFFGIGIRFLLVLALQVIFYKDLSIGGHAAGFIYVWFLLMLPLEISAMAGLIIGFFVGLSVDFFSQTPGIHAGASTFFMFLRPQILKILTPRGGYDPNQIPSFFQMGWPWFLVYSFSLILGHHFFAFFLEIYSMNFLGLIVLNSLSSTVLTWVSVTTLILLFSLPKR